jgi:uncharacterized protein YktA (UPF0223 family)
MTPLQAARAHCANYQPDGSCLGIYYNDDLSIDRARYRPCARCLLADSRRCEYFEEIIVPMRMSRETAVAAARADNKEKAVKAYLAFHKLVPTKAAAKKVCRECRRVEVEGGQRFCYKCAEVRRQRSNRRSQTKRRLNVRKTAISPIGAEALTYANQSGGYGSSGHPKFGSLTVVTRDAAFAKLREISR